MLEINLRSPKGELLYTYKAPQVPQRNESIRTSTKDIYNIDDVRWIIAEDGTVSVTLFVHHMGNLEK